MMNRTTFNIQHSTPKAQVFPLRALIGEWELSVECWVFSHRAPERSWNDRAGFSLIEVMVAIVILAIALTGLTAGITTALGSSKESELQTSAALLAAGQIELLRAQTDWTDGEEQGDCGAELPLYRWRQNIRPSDIEGLHEVDVVVENANTGKSIYELKTMLFQIPEESSGGGKPTRPRGNRS
jgi:prepilin-type N-terminal cleavage/methylation domain-containing protein